MALDGLSVHTSPVRVPSELEKFEEGRCSTPLPEQVLEDIGTSVVGEQQQQLAAEFFLLKFLPRESSDLGEFHVHATTPNSQRP